MKDKIDLIRDGVAAVRRGINLNDWIAEHDIAYDTDEDFQNFLRAEGITADDFWEEIETEIKARLGHDKPSDKKARKKTEQAINEWLSILKVRDRPIKPPKYSELEKFRGRGLSKLELNSKKIKDKNIDGIEKDLEGILAAMKKNEMENMDILEDIFNERISSIWGTRSEQDDITISMALDNFYHEVGELDLMKAEDRKMFYVYWENVQATYEDLVVIINEFKEKALKATSLDADVKQMLNELEVPPPYIEHFDHILLENVKGPITRVFELLETLGGKSPSITSYERENIRTTGEGAAGDIIDEETGEREFAGKKRPVLSQRTLEGETAVSSWKAEGLPREENIDPTEMEVDPILLWNLNNDLYEIAVGLGNDYNEIMQHLRYVKSQLPEGGIQNLIDMVIDEIEDSVEDIPEEIIYLPLTDWLKKIDPTIINRMDKVERETGKFFSLLNRLLLTSGQFPVHIDTRFGTAKRGGAGSSVQVTGSSHPDPKGFRQDRTQGDLDLPKEKNLKVSQELEKLIKKLKKALNDYYFHPMSSNFFVDDEKPDFMDEGGLDFGENLDPDSLTREGRFPFRALDFAFGTTPKQSAIRTLFEGLAEDSLFDIELLEDIKEFLKKTTRGFDLEGGWDSYKKELENLVLLIDKLFPGFEEENRIWAAGKLGEVLINHQQKLSKAKLFGKPISKLYKKYLEFQQDPTKILPMNQLRQLFSSSEFNGELRAEVDYRGDSGREWLRDMEDVIEEILQLTDPKEEETSKDKIKEERLRLNKSILIVHDYIRKINNQPIHYGSLEINNINDMDYLITKIETEDKIELTTTEISYIVNSIDSHNNISKSFGINENVVYKVRGLCR